MAYFFPKKKTLFSHMKIQTINYFIHFLFSRDWESPRQPLPDQRQEERATGASRGRGAASHTVREGLRANQGAPRREWWIYFFPIFKQVRFFFVFGKARGVDPFFFAFSWGGEGEEGPNRGNRTWRHLSL